MINILDGRIIPHSREMVNQHGQDVLDMGKKRNSGMGSYRKFLSPVLSIPLLSLVLRHRLNALRQSHAGGKQVA